MWQSYLFAAIKSLPHLECCASMHPLVLTELSLQQSQHSLKDAGSSICPNKFNGHSVCRYVPGVNLGEAWEVLKSELAGEPDSGDKLFEAAKFIGKQVLLVSLDS